MKYLTYQITFKCVVTLEARDKEEAVRLAWLRKNLDEKGTYKFLSVEVKKEVPDTTAGRGSQ